MGVKNIFKTEENCRPVLIFPEIGMTWLPVPEKTHRLRQLIDSALEAGPGVDVEMQLFGICHFDFPLQLTLACSADNGENVRLLDYQ